MASLIERFKGRKEPNSAEVAKERLKLVLVSDRTNLSPEKLSEMQTEIIEVIKRYLPLDAMDIEIKFEQRDRKNYLVADIPLQHRRQPLAAPDPPPVSSSPPAPLDPVIPEGQE
jgi:cell division topological specificity factor